MSEKKGAMKSKNLIIITILTFAIIVQGFQLRSYRKLTESAIKQAKEAIATSNEFNSIADIYEKRFNNCIKRNISRDRR